MHETLEERIARLEAELIVAKANELNTTNVLRKIKDGIGNSLLIGLGLIEEVKESPMGKKAELRSLKTAKHIRDLKTKGAKRLIEAKARGEARRAELAQRGAQALADARSKLLPPTADVDSTDEN